MIQITDDITFDETELEYEFVRSSGPGGQHVNKVASAVQLRFNIGLSKSLPQSVKERLIKIGGKRVTKEGDIVIKAQSHRSQEKNRTEAISRLVTLIEKATHKPKYRIPTKPSKAAKQRRLDQKKHRSRIKKERTEKY